jgi:hypothetical protein
VSTNISIFSSLCLKRKSGKVEKLLWPFFVAKKIKSSPRIVKRIIEAIVARRKKARKKYSKPGLPDGLFSNQK